MTRHQIFTRIIQRIASDLGEATAAHVQSIMVAEAGGIRVNFPDDYDLHREARNQRIRAMFRGFNHEELALRYGVSLRQVRRIVGET